MAFTYDATSAVGRVRLLADDRDEPNHFWEDAEVQALLDLNGQEPRLAAAQGLDIKAADRAWIQAKIVLDGLRTDGTAVAGALAGQAAELRRQVYDGEADPSDPGFAVAEEWLDQFTLREIFQDRALREQT